MRGDPEHLNAEYAAQAAASRDKFAAERESYRAEAEADAAAEAVMQEAAQRRDDLKADLLRIARMEFGISDEETRAYKAGLDIGRRDERNRLLTALTRLEQQTAALWQEGTPVTKAVAAYTAAVRKIVEGEGR